MEYHRPVGSGRGRDGILLPIHAPGQSSAPLAQGLHPLREYYYELLANRSAIYNTRSNISRKFATRFIILVMLYLQYTFLSDCFDRIAEEAKWDDPGE